MPFRIAKQFRFEAAHSLPHLPEGHKCKRVHGHSYCIEVVLSAFDLDARGFAGVDYADLDRLKRWLELNWDHRNLNEVMECPTTAEYLAWQLFALCKPWWPALECVRVCETPSTWVEYRE